MENLFVYWPPAGTQLYILKPSISTKPYILKPSISKKLYILKLSISAKPYILKQNKIVLSTSRYRTVYFQYKNTGVYWRHLLLALPVPSSSLICEYMLGLECVYMQGSVCEKMGVD